MHLYHVHSLQGVSEGIRGVQSGSVSVGSFILFPHNLLTVRSLMLRLLTVF